VNELEALRDWIGREETQHDIITAAPVTALAATLDHDPHPVPDGSALPPLWHWLYFTPRPRASAVGPDGHARRGGFLPPVPLPRRMWAGGRLVFHEPLRVGDAVTRTSRIASVDIKHGRSGPLVFVTVQHELHTARGLAISEAHDIVYRDAPIPGAPAPTPTAAPDNATCSREVTPDPVLLFRYSALTFNGHRIHYDRPYAMQEEGYPGLVVHGPLIATLLLDLLQREMRRHERADAAPAVVTRFSFKALRPLCDIHPFAIGGRISHDRDGDTPGTVQLWARDHEGWLAMQATADIA
jgi:3-methylfumaryl-CoA hydratase